jgi:predicted nicotinamide N-methyase
VSLETARELPADYQVLLASDVLYEVGNRDFLRTERDRGRTVLVSDPLRRDNPRLALTPRCTYQVKTVPDVDYPIASAVIYHL